MRKLLLLALLLYDIVGSASRMGYDYDEMDVMKRHGDRSWRRKGIVKSMERVWDDRKRHDYEAMNINPQRYYEDMEPKGYSAMERQRPEPDYNKRHYDDIDKLQKALTAPKSIEMDHPANLGPSMPPNIMPSNLNPNINMEGLPEKKLSTVMNCDRPHERYEACFAGCAAVTCDNPRDRLRPCYPFCEPGCVCVHPYVRDDRTHKCVLIDDCTKGLKGIPDLGDES